MGLGFQINLLFENIYSLFFSNAMLPVYIFSFIYMIGGGDLR